MNDRNEKLMRAQEGVAFPRPQVEVMPPDPHVLVGSRPIGETHREEPRRRENFSNAHMLPSEVAELLHCCVRTLKRRQERYPGFPVPVVIGASNLYVRSEVREYLDRRKAERVNHDNGQDARTG